VYIRPFPSSGGKCQISTGGGFEPQRRGEGKELFYATLHDPARIMALDIAEEMAERGCDARNLVPEVIVEATMALFWSASWSSGCTLQVNRRPSPGSPRRRSRSA
jgi:hypothetical protein